MSQTINIWSGEAESYDAFRPQSPPIIMDILTLHSVEYGNTDRLIGLVISWGSFRYLTQGVTEQELGIDQLKDVAHRVIGDAPIPWYLSYRVRIGIK